MLNPESVDKVYKFSASKQIIEILFSDNANDECLTIYLDIIQAQRLARMILKATDWRDK